MTFANAVCVCHGLTNAGSLRTHAPPGGAASVGVNQGSSAATGSQIEGGYVPYAGLDVAGELDVRDGLLTTGSLGGAGTLKVGGDLSVGGSLVFAGSLQLGGKLRSASPPVAVPGISQAPTAAYVAPAGPPCACDPESLLPIAQGVAAAASNNDNAAHGLSDDAADLLGSGSLTLVTGSYYFKNAERVGASTIVIDGAVTLYLDGSTVSVGEHQIQLTAGSSLDLYVSGQLVTAGTIALGDPSHPQNFRLFVGGAGSMLVTAGAQSFAGLVYAPQADIAFAGGTVVEGAVFARSLTWAGALDVTYASGGTPSTACTSTSTGTAPVGKTQ
jgi:hypothetical protein